MMTSKAGEPPIVTRTSGLRKRERATRDSAVAARPALIFGSKNIFRRVVIWRRARRLPTTEAIQERLTSILMANENGFRARNYHEEGRATKTKTNDERLQHNEEKRDD
ncbi:MAG: hypothetical protein WCF57_17735 [Pyrinomonadaceae bacterium]